MYGALHLGAIDSVFVRQTTHHGQRWVVIEVIASDGERFSITCNGDNTKLVHAESETEASVRASELFEEAMQ